MESHLIFVDGGESVGGRHLGVGVAADGGRRGAGRHRRRDGRGVAQRQPLQVLKRFYCKLPSSRNE